MNNNTIELSVIIPVYNVERYLSDCIDSIYNQDLDVNDFEVVLVNDGSSDSSLSICQDYAITYPNIKIINQENQGLSIARNNGIKSAAGNYLYFIDSDDFLMRNSLKFVFEIIKKNELDFFGFHMYRTQNRLVQQSYGGQFNIIFKGSGLDILNDFNFNNGACWYIFHRDLLEELRFTEGRFCEDGLFTPRLLMRVKNAFISSDEIYCYYENQTSIVNNKNITKNLKIIDDMFFAVADFNAILKSVPDDNLKAWKRLRHRQETYLFYGIIRCLKLNRPSREIFTRINKLNFENYAVYPMKEFKGYNKKEQFLIFLMNYKWSLRVLNFLNKKLQIIK